MYSLYRELWKNGVEMRVVPVPGTENAVSVILSKNGYEESVYIWAQQYDKWFSELKTRELHQRIRDIGVHVKKLQGID